MTAIPITAIFWKMKCLRIILPFRMTRQQPKKQSTNKMFGAPTLSNPKFQKRPFRKTKKTKRRKNRRSWTFRLNR
jgi:hypothetical protein